MDFNGIAAGFVILGGPRARLSDSWFGMLYTGIAGSCSIGPLNPYLISGASESIVTNNTFRWNYATAEVPGSFGARCVIMGNRFLTTGGIAPLPAVVGATSIDLNLEAHTADTTNPVVF
jgi:hypothetical protein